MNSIFLDALKESISKELPGPQFQNEMSPISNNERYRIPLPNHKTACVCTLIHPKNDTLYTTYIKRASIHPKDKHAGQIGFPGGKLEEDDDSLAMCALRETEEEIGINKSSLEIIGSLTPLYVYASNFMVYPFVAFSNEINDYILQESEVAGYYEVPLTHLIDPKSKAKKKLQLASGLELEAPGYIIEDQFLWGATAMITSELEEIIKRTLSTSKSH